MPGTRLSTAIDQHHDIALRGYVDSIDEVAGIEGWALDRSDPGAAVPIDLCLGDHVVARTRTGIARDDLHKLVGRDTAPGFRFDAAALRLVAAEARLRPEATLLVRIGGTDLELGADSAFPTAQRVARQIAETDARDAADERLSLPALLVRLADRAGELLTHPLRPIPENAQGYIEMITVNPAGYVWFTGWMNQGHLLAFSAVIADRGKTPAGVALMCYDREDLLNHACGIVGVIASDWSPNTLSQDFALFFGKDSRLYFRAHQPLRVVPATEFVANFERIRAQCRNDRRGPAIIRMLNELDHWSLTNAAAQGFVAHASVDRLLLVPGFGYLAEGWILSPAKRVAQLHLRIADRTLRASAETLYHKPRADLLQAFPAYAVLTRKAGFVACFPGDIGGDDVADPTLKLVFEDGGTWNQPIPPAALLQLGHSANLDDLRLFYPTLEDEPFFPRLARALRQSAPSSPPRPHAVAPRPAVAIFVLPPDRCDLVCLFADIAHYLATDERHGIAAIAPLSASRPDAVRLFGDLARAAPNTASLFFAGDDAQPFDLIGPVLEATRARRFVFVGPSVFLSASGWLALAQSLAEDHDALEFFELAAETWQSADSGELPESLCFAWSAAAFTAWRATAPRVLGGFYRDNGLAAGRPPPLLRRDAGRLTRPRHTGGLEAAVNALALGLEDA